MLHITNGESVIQSFRAAKLDGTYLSWLDVLHEGPVPDLPFDALAGVRARAIADLGWGDFERIRKAFSTRNAVLASYLDHEEVVLWFEHDLFDQLQLIQVLDWFAGRDLGRTRLSLINIGAFPGVEPFYGLGQLTGEQLASLTPTRLPVTLGQLALGKAAWKAFRSPSPSTLVGLLSRDTSALPFLRPALQRFIEEYPSVHNGLSRTEQQLLEATAAGGLRRADIFPASQQRETSRFLGDASAWLRLDLLASDPAPALRRLAADQYQITSQGRKLLDGSADWIRSRGGLDRWFGGVHLAGPDAAWRYDRERGLTAQTRA
ncbi:MAG: hypothetical protein U0Q18_19605 [Bryobacteraceae bacterium]